MTSLFVRAHKMGAQLYGLPVRLWERLIGYEAAKHRDQEIISNWDQVRMIRKEMEILRPEEGYE